MKIVPAENDAPAFTAQVEALLEGIARVRRPAVLVLIKIDNWFGPNWLRFSTGAHVPVAGCKAGILPIPLFVPNRVASQRRFAAPQYNEVSGGGPLHTEDIEGARERRMSDLPERTAIVWYSGNSRVNRRGSVMAYMAVGNLYRPWYAGWTEGQAWHIEHSKGIDKDEVSNLTRIGFGSTREVEPTCVELRR